MTDIESSKLDHLNLNTLDLWYKMNRNDPDFIRPKHHQEREPQIVNYDPGYFEQFKEPRGIKIWEI